MDANAIIEHLKTRVDQRRFACIQYAATDRDFESLEQGLMAAGIEYELNLILRMSGRGEEIQSPRPLFRRG